MLAPASRRAAFVLAPLSARVPSARWTCTPAAEYRPEAGVRIPMVLYALLATADAFSPAVHRALAARAFALESAADPALAVHAAAFARGAVDEDWNLVRKWTLWHHYYNPSFTVRSLWRRPSDARVAMLDVAITEAFGRADPGRGWLLAGLLAHHVQDMASPPHVVPVAHGLFDGFESAATAALVPDLMGEAVPDLDPIAAHRGLAVATLASLDEPMLCDAGPIASTTLWEPRAGGYGRTVTRFGTACGAGSATFLQARLDAALAYTRAVIRAVSRLD